MKTSLPKRHTNSKSKSQIKTQTPRRLTHAKVQSEKKTALGKAVVEKTSAAHKKFRSKSKVAVVASAAPNASAETLARAARKFNYDRNYKALNLRETPDLYRVGVGEQGVLLVEPYKSEILPHWKFKTPADAKKSATAITKLFKEYRDAKDFVGMDMARKFLQMGFTRSRRYANHKSGRKYDKNLKVLPIEEDPEKAASAEIFMKAWKKAEADPVYHAAKVAWKTRLG